MNINSKSLQTLNYLFQYGSAVGSQDLPPASSASQTFQTLLNSQQHSLADSDPDASFIVLPSYCRVIFIQQKIAKNLRSGFRLVLLIYLFYSQ